jgi:DMSO/TMAO reductase YedYZ molybdopterin-dependent catalytic subunit
MTMTNGVPLHIDGEVASPATLSQAEFAAFAEEDRIDDVSQVEQRRQGRAVRLIAVLRQVEPTDSATHVTLHASTDDFAASIPLDAARDVGILIYEINGEPLDTKAGGPFRFLIPNAAECKTADLDACANVKFLDRLELTAGKGRDTR